MQNTNLATKREEEDLLRLVNILSLLNKLVGLQFRAGVVSYQ